MDARSDASTQELARLKLKLEDDVVFAPHAYGDMTYYHVELPSRSKFFRIGVAEYTFASLLDGHTTVAEALSLTARSLGPEAFSERDAASICAWLIETGLAQPQHTSQAARLHGAARKQRSRGWMGRLNPFWIKLPLLSPDPLLERLRPWIGWIHSPLAILVALVLFALALATVVTCTDRLAASSIAVFSPSNWIWLLVAWVLLKGSHELGHALVCKCYGGKVRESGLILILLMPIPYVDVTSSWRFRSRWQRMHTAAAGIYVELLMASLAALVWVRAESAVTCHLLYSLMLMASVTTLLFNANPLMRFDGYYILADLVEIPNLYSEGSRYLKGLARRLFLGTQDRSQLGWRWRDVLVRLYGAAAFCWRIVVCASLAIAASVLFHGAGLIIAVMGTAACVIPPVLRAIRSVVRQHQVSPISTVRAILAGFAVAAAVVALCYVPWPGAYTAPGIVEYRDLVVVRAESPGFVTAIHVRNGQLVRAGQRLIELTNDRLLADVRDLELAIAQSKLKRRSHLQKGEQGAVQVEWENQRALQKRLAEKQRQLDSLTVRAPVSGRVMARNLDVLPMTYQEEGAEILAIGNDGNKQLRVSIAQENAPLFADRVGQPVSFRIRSSGAQQGDLSRVIPRATKKPPHAALCAPYGGPLAVTKTDRQDQEDFYELPQPRFTGLVELPPADCDRHQAGEFGYVMIRASEAESIAQTLSRRILDWVEHKVDRAKSRWRDSGTPLPRSSSGTGS